MKTEGGQRVGDEDEDESRGDEDRGQGDVGGQIGKSYITALL
jgi:hypothetical protein